MLCEISTPTPSCVHTPDTPSRACTPYTPSHMHTPLTHMCLHLIILVSSLGEREQINHSFNSKLILNVYFDFKSNLVQILNS